MAPIVSILNSIKKGLLSLIPKITFEFICRSLIVLILFMLLVVFKPLWLFIATGAVVAIYGLSIYTNTRFEDWFNPIKWKSISVVLLRKLLNVLDGQGKYLTDDDIEQYMFRILACPKCVSKKTCVGCGCATLPKMNVRKEECTLGRWGQFESKRDWKKYKEDYNVKFSLTINGINIDDIKEDLED